MLAALGADYGGRMLVRTDMDTGKSYILAGLYDGKPYNALNDVTIDEQGRIYFSDPRYLGHEPIFQPGYAVYRLDPDGTVDADHHRRRQDQRRPGLARPEDPLRGQQRQRLVRLRAPEARRGSADPGPPRLAAYDLAADGTVSQPPGAGRLRAPTAGPTA